MFIRTFTRVFAGVAIAITFAGTSFAQSTVLVVDTAKVLEESIVGKHVARQLEAIYSSAGSEMKAKLSPIQSKAKSLQAQASTKTSVEEIRADASLRAQAQALQTDQQKLQVEQYYTNHAAQSGRSGFEAS